MDWFTALAPVLLLPVVALLRYTGCFTKPPFHPRPPGTISVLPEMVMLKVGGSQQFAAIADWGDTDFAWSLSDSSGAQGNISQTGFYTAPQLAPSGFVVQVIATATDLNENEISGQVSVEVHLGDIARFVRFDDATQGTWSGVYGSQGHVLAHLPLPDSNVASFPTPPNIFLFEDPSTDVRALQNPANLSTRYSYVWFDASLLTFEFAFNDDVLHQIAVYCVDWTAQGRRQSVAMFKSGSTEQFDQTQELAGFQSGTWLVWQIAGHVRMEVVHEAGPNALVSGIFFG